MRNIVLLIILSVLCASVFASLPMSELMKWEQSASSILEIENLEIFEVSFSQGEEAKTIQFSYDVELESDPGLYITYQCSGVVSEQGYEIKDLSCEEEEPILWDEF